VVCGLSIKWKLVAPVNISSAFNPSTQPFHGRKREERKKRRGKVKRKEGRKGDVKEKWEANKVRTRS